MSATCPSGCATTARPGPVALELTQRPDRVRSLDPTADTAPPWFHLVQSAPGVVLLVDDSSVFALDPALAARGPEDPDLLDTLASVRGGPGPFSATGLDGELPSHRSISLTVAQSCNLGCSYCYADEGRFGGDARRMPIEVARRAVDELLAGTPTGGRALVGFIGGEPLLARSVVHDTVAYATGRARRLGCSVGFSITTNGTLVTAADVALFRDHPFTVTVSVDGGAAVHDRHRRRHDGTGTWRSTVEGVRPLLDQPGGARVSARVSVTRDELDIRARVRDLIAAGFEEVGVSPVRTGPDPELVLRGDDWATYLAGLIAAADDDVDRLSRTPRPRRWHFANLGTAMTEIHRGTARPLPCGAAYGYLSVDVDGHYATCHRTVGDPRYALGRLGARDDDARRHFLGARRVDRQEPCRSCWARHLCGGGCHAEVVEVGRDNCDMVRGWLDHCLGRYPAVRAAFPDLF